MLHQSSGRWQLGLGLSLITVAMWGTLPVAESVVLQQLDVYTLNWFRFASSFVMVSVYLGVQPSVWTKSIQFVQTGIRLTRTELGLLSIATLGLALDYLLYLQGLAHTSAANAEILIQLAPVLLSLGAIVIFKERYTRSQWAGVGVLTLGFILFFHEQLRSLLIPSDQYLLGSALVLLASIAWAAYALAQKQLLQRLPASSILVILYGICTLMFMPFAVPRQIFALSPLHFGLLMFCGLNTAIAYAAFSEALEHWEASKISAMTTLTPIVTLSAVWALSAIMPALIPPAQIAPSALGGAAIVILGSMVVALGESGRRDGLRPGKAHRGEK